MLPFGPAYAQHGADVLRVLLCASLLRTAIALFSAISRVLGRGTRLAAIELALLVIVLGAALPLARAAGIEGVALAWLLANAAICAAVAPSLIAVVRRAAPPSPG
jgi:O-antigen/teichoic acid export membrane protein